MAQVAEISNINVLKSTKREYQALTEPEKIRYVLEEHTSYRNLWMQSTFPPVEAVYVSSDPENNQVSFQLPPGLTIGKHFSLFCTLKKQLVFDFHTVDYEADGKLTGEFARVRIADAGRVDHRYVLPEGVAHAKKFALSKNKIDLNPHTPLVANKIIFKEFERKLAMKFPGLQIFDHGIENEAIESKLIKKQELPVYVEDAQNPESYKQQHEGYADFGSELVREDVDIHKMAINAKDAGSMSILCVPIIYENLAGEHFSIGYIKAVGKGRRLGENEYKLLKKESEDIVEKIKDANTIVIDESAHIHDISLKGACLMVKNPELHTYIMQRQTFLFDLVFKMQPPVRLFSKICHISEGYINDEKTLIIGVSFAGKAYSLARTNLQAYIDQIQPNG